MEIEKWLEALPWSPREPSLGKIPAYAFVRIGQYLSCWLSKTVAWTRQESELHECVKLKRNVVLANSALASKLIAKLCKNSSVVLLTKFTAVRWTVRTKMAASRPFCGQWTLTICCDNLSVYVNFNFYYADLFQLNWIWSFEFSVLKLPIVRRNLCSAKCIKLCQIRVYLLNFVMDSYSYLYLYL